MSSAVELIPQATPARCSSTAPEPAALYTSCGPRHGVDRSAGARRLDGLAARHRGGAAGGAARGGGERAGAGAAADVARRAAREGRRRGVPHRPHRLAAGDAVAGRRHRRVRRRRRAGDGDAAAPLGAPPPRRLPAVAEAPDAHAVDAGGGARRRRARGRREWPPRRRGGARRRAAAGDARAAVDPAGRGRHVLGARDHRALRPVRVRRRPRHRWPPLPRPPRDLVAVRDPTAPRARARNSAAQFRRAIHSGPNRPQAAAARAVQPGAGRRDDAGAQRPRGARADPSAVRQRDRGDHDLE